MTICDICSTEADGRVVPVGEFQRNVAEGRFNPFRLGLVSGRVDFTEEQDFNFWTGVVRENETDWFLCHRCHQAYAQATAAPRTPAPAPGSSLPDSLETLRRLHPLPAQPGVPADWRPGLMAGLFGRGKPWGDREQAIALLRHGRIAEARELLQRLVAQGADNPTRLLFCFEGRRPPHDDSFRISQVVPTLSPADKTLIDMLVAVAQGNYDWLGESMLAASATTPGSEFAAFLLLTGFVATSDLWLQTQLLHPRKRALESMIVCRPFKAVALFIERRHDEAWAAFQQCVAEPASIVTAYEKGLNLSATPAEHAKLGEAARLYGEIGLGLVLFDLGYAQERRAHFARLTPRLNSGLAEACRMLA